MRKNGELTIETLEQMFIYLGCANIPTQEAMNGAVPLESLCGAHKNADESVSCLELSSLASMPLDWGVKAVWFSGDHLGLSTVENVHWSRISIEVERMLYQVELMGGSRKGKRLLDKLESFARVYYSEIDRFGKFVKFPVAKKLSRNRDIAVKKLFNPSWLFAFGSESLRCLSSPNDKLYQEKRLSFLAPFLCGLAQSLGSYWLVKTRFDSVCPSLTLLTDPTGVKEFWKLRDVPPGRTRRAALLHWVEQHWRQLRSDPEVETFVRSHMRGESQFKHGSFEATITPSVVDSIDEEAAKSARLLMKKRKQDRRVRAKKLEAASR